jgi:hypothetical protein
VLVAEENGVDDSERTVASGNPALVRVIKAVNVVCGASGRGVKEHGSQHGKRRRLTALRGHICKAYDP